MSSFYGSKSPHILSRMSVDSIVFLSDLNLRSRSHKDVKFATMFAVAFQDDMAQRTFLLDWI
jgi:hypothetical protein